MWSFRKFRLAQESVSFGGLLGALAMTMLIAGCGFHLRGAISYPFDTVFVNMGEEVKVAGAELQLRGAINEAWTFSTSYTYSREKARGTDIQLDNRPLHAGKLGLAFAPVGGLRSANPATRTSSGRARSSRTACRSATTATVPTSPTPPAATC